MDTNKQSMGTKNVVLFLAELFVVPELFSGFSVTLKNGRLGENEKKNSESLQKNFCPSSDKNRLNPRAQVQLKS